MHAQTRRPPHLVDHCRQLHLVIRHLERAPAAEELGHDGGLGLHLSAVDLPFDRIESSMRVKRAACVETILLSEELGSHVMTLPSRKRMARTYPQSKVQ